MNYFKVAAAIILFLLILLLTYVGYIKLLNVDVVFYASLYSALVASAIFGVLLFSLSIFKSNSLFEKIQTLIICILIGYAFAISVPTVIDRSLSFYVLEKLQQRGGGIQFSKFHYIFTNEYMREHRLVDVRLTEQAESGTILIEDDCVMLTPRGERLASFSMYFRKHFLPKRRLLLGEYTDALIDPFARSDERPDYLCDSDGRANRDGQ